MSLRYKLIDEEGYLNSRGGNAGYIRDFFLIKGGHKYAVIDYIDRDRGGKDRQGIDGEVELISKSEFRFFEKAEEPEPEDFNRDLAEDVIVWWQDAQYEESPAGQNIYNLKPDFVLKAEKIIKNIDAKKSRK